MHRVMRFDSRLIKVAAVNRVLASLGGDASALIGQYLLNVHGISLNVIEGQGSYSLEQLREALYNLLGEQATKIILESVYLQADEFSEALNLTLPKYKSRSKSH